MGVCNRTLAKAEQAKELYGFQWATDNPEEIIENQAVNVINVCNPNIEHQETVIKALKAGKHVYCEKPLAAGEDEAEEILKSLDQHHLVTQMAFQYRFLPATMRAKELITSGKLGRILSFRACYLHSGSVNPSKPIGWKQEKAAGGGALLDLGSHVLDLMYYLMGEYAAVLACTDIIYDQRPNQIGEKVSIDAEDLVIITARMKNGGVGTIEASKVATGTNDELRFEIHGSLGSLRFNLMEPNWLEFFDNTLPEMPLGGWRGYTKIECIQRYPKPGGDFPPAKLSIGWTRAHVHSLYHFLEHVCEGKEPSPSIREGAYIQQVMARIAESARLGQWVQIGVNRG
jgi:predicted dehydrogenase